jgi:hypothetical protein
MPTGALVSIGYELAPLLRPQQSNSAHIWLFVLARAPDLDVIYLGEDPPSRADAPRLL